MGGNMRQFALLVAIVVSGGIEARADDANFFEVLSCLDVVNAGWQHMPSVADYIQGKPGWEKLGFGSECALGSLVFSQCWLQPKWSVKKAIDTLIFKANHNIRLPETPACGA